MENESFLDNNQRKKLGVALSAVSDLRDMLK